MKHFLPLLAAACAPGFLPLASVAQNFGAVVPAASPSDLSRYPTADALWLRIEDLQRGPKTRPTSAEEYRQIVTSEAGQLAAGTAQFLKLYPNDPRKWDARLLQIDANSALSTIQGDHSDLVVTAQLRQLAAESEASSSVRGQARYELLGLSLRDYIEGNRLISAASIVDQLHRFIEDFPTYPSLDVLKYQVAKALDPSDPAAATQLLGELADSGEGKIPDQARKELATRERLKSPLDLRFTAVDGSAVDLSKLRGKVVLLDFWATWGGPCRAEVPNLVAVYNKLHDKGFEVVGISLDQDRNSLLAFTAANGMTWPQYFDGKGWENTISSSFAIQQVPTMWLVNKQGYVVSTNGRADLEGTVEKLLAESDR
jgi:thiol-disulfide isomerase/thioredoxin